MSVHRVPKLNTNNTGIYNAYKHRVSQSRHREPQRKLTLYGQALIRFRDCLNINHN